MTVCDFEDWVIKIIAAFVYYSRSLRLLAVGQGSCLDMRILKQSWLLLLLSRFSCVRFCEPTDSSSPGKARTLEWVAISFSNKQSWRGSQSEELSHVNKPSWK